MKNPFKPKYIGAGYLLRWHLIPRNRWFNIYLHKFIGDDDDRALHDHPWWSFSVRLRGQLREHYKLPGLFEFSPFGCGKLIEIVEERMAPRFVYRPATFAHRLELVGNKPAWTIFITGPRVREWGFHCPKGWVHWTKMTAPDGTPIGGCDD